MGIGNTIFLVPGLGEGEQSIYDSNAARYIRKVEQADGELLENDVKDAINDFVIGCKTDGIWNAIKASCILAGARTLEGALVPLKGSAPTNIDDNFVSGDYDRKTGLKGDGSDKRLNSNRDNDDDPQDSQHLSVFVTEADDQNTGIVGLIGSGFAGDGLSQIFYSFNAGNYGFRSRSGAVTKSAAISSGFHGISRFSSDSVSVILPGHDPVETVSSVTPVEGGIIVFRRASGTATNSRFAFYSIGESIDLAKLETRVTNLLNTFNSVI